MAKNRREYMRDYYARKKLQQFETLDDRKMQPELFDPVKVPVEKQNKEKSMDEIIEKKVEEKIADIIKIDFTPIDETPMEEVISKKVDQRLDELFSKAVETKIQHVENSTPVKKNVESKIQHVENSTPVESVKSPFNSVFKAVEKVEFNTLLKITPLFLLIIAITTFLTIEQITFYSLKNYSFSYALFVSLLTEISILALSFYQSFVKNWKWKSILAALLILTLWQVGGVITTSSEKQDMGEVKNSLIVTNLEGNLKRLKAIEAQKLEAIQAWDSEKYRSKKESLLKDLEQGTSLEIKNTQTKLDKIMTKGTGLASGEADTMKNFRLLALAWNVVLAHLLAYFWRREGS